LRGNRDESARASHLVVKKDLLMTYETDLLGQAETEKYSLSTFFERKTMSTKTAFKRLALVAAAALAIGGVSAVSAQAVNPPDLVVVNGTGATTGGALPTYTAAVTQIAGPANYITLTPAIPTGSDYITVTGGTFVGGATSAVVTTTANVNVATPTAGTVTVNAYEITGGVASTTAQTTVTITVVTALPGTVYSTQKVYASTGATFPANSPTSTTDAAYAVTAAAGASNVANFVVSQVDANGVALTSGWKAVTATVTNGLLTSTTGTYSLAGVYAPSTAATAASTYATAAANATGSEATDFVLSGLPNVAGTATVTIYVNGVVAKTYSATFTGSAVKIVLTAINPVIAVGTPLGVTANTDALEVQEFDANGNAIASNLNTITVTPASSAIATASALDYNVAHTLGNITGGTALSNSVAGVTLTGVAAGTTTFTATDSTNSLTSAAVSVRVSSATPTTVVFATDLSAYPAGGAGTLTATLSDAAGTVPAGAYTVLTGTATSSYALAVGTLPGASITVNDSGVATVAFNAPLSDATGVTITGTGVTGVTVTPATFDVASGSSQAANAATDAANEATDAANAATDAANAAADSADAATQAAQDAGDKADAALAAVTALSQQVTTLLAKVAALAATIAKIAKKVKA